MKAKFLKFISLLLALSFIVPLISCQSNSDDEETVTITFEDDDKSTFKQVVTAGEPVALKTISEIGWSHSGKVFAYWWGSIADSTTGSYTNVRYSDGETVTLSQDVKLFSSWTDRIYKITFNANGGAIATTEQTSYSASCSLIPAKTLGVSRLGYTFKGWAKSDSAESAEFEDNASVTLEDDILLYAVWEANPKRTVTFNENNGTITTNTQIIVEAVPTALEKAETLQLTREGYIFKGWSRSQSAESVDINDGGSITVSGDITLYAVWAYNTSYTVTFNATTGTITTTSQTISGETIKGDISGTLKTASALGLSKSGYKFKGWASSSTSSTVAYSDGKELTLTGDITLYAIWDKIVTYTITFDAGGGYISTTSQIATGTESEGVSVTLKTASALGLSKSGYVFSGWATSSYGSARFSNGASITVTGNVTLYAVWSLPQYTITYVVDSQSYGQLRAPQVKKTITGAQTISLPSASSLGYSKSGYEFLGWKTSQSSNTYYKVGSSMTISKDTTLYAAWKELYIYVYLYHPGYTAASGAKFGTMAVSVGGASKSFSLSMRNGSYTSSKVKLSGVSGSNAWATSFTYQKTGYKATSVSKSGYMNFVNGGTYRINVVTGDVTKTN